MKDRQIAMVLGALAVIVVIICILLYIGSDTGQEKKQPIKGEEIAKRPSEIPKEPAIPVTEKIPEVEEAAEEIEPEIEGPIPPPIASGKCDAESRASAKKRRQLAPEGMVYVPGGAFVMGSPPKADQDDEIPAHQVCLHGFYIDKLEVTNAEFKRFVDATGYVTDLEKDPSSALGRSWRRPYGSDLTAEDLPDHPVVCVSWKDANMYAKWAGKRLPTEAEWEKAARGTDARLYPWGNSPPTEKLSNIADKSAGLKWSDSSMDDNQEHTAPVGSFSSGKSPYGVEDMAGNVWEWCFDWWEGDYYADSPSNNPTGPSDGEFRVIRGGSWFDFVEGTRTAYRMYFKPQGASADIGFRCVKDVG